MINMVKALNRLLKNSIVILSVIDPKIPAVKKYSDFDVIPAQAGIQVKAFKENGCQINTPGMTSLTNPRVFQQTVKEKKIF